MPTFDSNFFPPDPTGGAASGGAAFAAGLQAGKNAIDQTKKPQPTNQPQQSSPLRNWFAGLVTPRQAQPSAVPTAASPAMMAPAPAPENNSSIWPGRIGLLP